MSKRKLSEEDSLKEWIPDYWGPHTSITPAQWMLLLVRASKEGDIELAKIALNHGADINGIAHLSIDDEKNFKFHEMDGQTPLHMAAHSWRAEAMVKFLLDHGSDIFKKNVKSKRRNISQLPIFSHVFEGKEKSVKLLLDKADEMKRPLLEEKSDFLGETPLLMSLHGYREKSKVVQLLLQRHADINACNNSGLSALLICAGAGHSESLKELLKSPKFPIKMIESRDKEGNTALHLAVVHKIRFSQVFDIGWEYFKTSLYGIIIIKQPPSEFSEPFIKSHLQMIDLLLQAGVDVKAINNKGETPIGSINREKEREKSYLQYNFNSSPECLIEARIKLYDQTIEKLEEWKKIWRVKLFTMLWLQESLPFIPQPLLELTSDYVSDDPLPANTLCKLSLFSLQKQAFELSLRNNNDQRTSQSNFNLLV